MRVLIACESSGTVREAFRALGHDAWSCDLQPADDGSLYHIQGDAIEAAYSQTWGLMIAHPSCTYLTSFGLHWNRRVPGREAARAVEQPSGLRTERPAAPADRWKACSKTYSGIARAMAEQGASHIEVTP